MRWRRRLLPSRPSKTTQPILKTPGAPGGAAKPVIVIKRRRRLRHVPTHGGGGAWKVAYADFVTAMMSFFLLLWLLNVTTAVQRESIANYFDPASVSVSVSGAGGVLGGKSIMEPGAQMSNARPLGPEVPLPGSPPTATADEDREGDAKGRRGAATSDPESRAAAAERQAEEREERRFDQVEKELRQAMQSVPELKALAQNVIIDRTPEGLRIQLVDQDGASMFPLGSAEMFDHTRKLLSLVQQAIGRLPERISIRGHTDATPYHSAGQYNNWDLSTDRANASRRALETLGLDPTRVADVVGKADRELLFPDKPASPQNRRISIILLRQAPPPAPVR